ncbi:MAG: DUF721 domain-containing protein [Bacteroidetes bacterium]|nr:DUF721 domain-containing protein [Bacteroidota bacterium]
MRKSNEQSLGDVINQLLDAYKLRGKINEIKVKRTWEDLMGVAIAKRTTNLFIKDTTLFIRLSSAPLREELMFQREKLKP